MIKDYSFGRMTVNKRRYDCDVEVRWDGSVLKWWRQESHIFSLSDAKRAIEAGPEMIVMGTGESGAAKVDENLIKYLRENEIEHVREKTPLAVKFFNQAIAGGKKVIGLFHLTC